MARNGNGDNGADVTAGRGYENETAAIMRHSHNLMRGKFRTSANELLSEATGTLVGEDEPNED